MADPADGAVTSYEAIGVREDLSDIIYLISPTETPGMSMFGRGTATQRAHEWQADELAAAANNAVIEGLTAPANDTVRFTDRFINRLQISQKTLEVTGTMEVVNKAGRKSELAYQLAKRAKELKRDIEFSTFGRGAPFGSVIRDGAGPDTAGQSTTIMAVYHAAMTQQATPDLPGIHISRDATTGLDGGFDTATGLFDPQTDSSAVRPLIESLVKSVIQGAWTNGGDPTVIMAAPFNKTVISGFSGNSTRFDRGEDKRLVAAIDVYVSDFGEHRIVPNRFQRGRDVHVLTPELWSIDYLRGFRQHALAKTGDTEQRQLLCEWCLRASNHSGSGIVADLTAA